MSNTLGFYAAIPQEMAGIWPSIRPETAKKAASTLRRRRRRPIKKDFIPLQQYPNEVCRIQKLAMVSASRRVRISQASFTALSKSA